MTHGDAAPTRPTPRSTPTDVAVTNTDNDAPGITVTPTTGLTTTEAGGTATFTVVLTTQPTRGRDHRPELERHDRGHGGAGEPDLHGRELDHGADGDGDGRRRRPVDDGDVAYTIVTHGDAAPTRPTPRSTPADVAVTNTDNDSAGHHGDADDRLTTTEAGGTATFTVVLNTQPTADVTIA